MALLAAAWRRLKHLLGIMALVDLMIGRRGWRIRRLWHAFQSLLVSDVIGVFLVFEFVSGLRVTFSLQEQYDNRLDGRQREAEERPDEEQGIEAAEQTATHELGG
ncbi:hypothetical protein N9L19_00575 [bacterium]|nr:hypothetical protein [bacterium]